MRAYKRMKGFLILADNETFLKRILKVFAIIAVMIAVCLCALLVGCGTPQDTDNPDEPKVGVDNSNTNIDTDEEKTETENPNKETGGEDLEYTGGGCASLAPTHFILTNLDSEYDVDNFVIPMSYAFRHTSYPYYAYLAAKENGSRVDIIADYEIYFFADKEFHYAESSEYNYETLESMQQGEVFDNFYMIEKLSFPKQEDGLVDMEAVINTLDSSYEGYYDLINEYWFFDHNLNVNIPCDFLDDSGTISFNLLFLIKLDSVAKCVAPGVYTYVHVDDVLNLGYTDGCPCFDYSIEGDKVKLSNISNGLSDFKPSKKYYDYGCEPEESMTSVIKSTGREVAEIISQI